MDILPDPQDPSPPLDDLVAHLEQLVAELAGLGYEEDQDRFGDIVAELVNHGDAMRARLFTMVRSLNYQERCAALQALGRLGDADARPLILEGLHDANWKVQRAAAEAVAAHPFDEAFARLLELADDDNRDLRLAAMDALGHLQAPAALDTLHRCLDAADWRLRQAAAAAVSHIGSAASLGPLITHAGDDDEDVRNAIDEGLETLLAQSDEGSIQAILDDIREAERQRLLESLQKEPRPRRLKPLVDQLQTSLSALVDETELSRFGRVMTAVDQVETLDRAYERDKELDGLVKMLEREGNSSVILVGESGVGKTAIVHALARRVAHVDHGITVLETSTPELMVGTKYIGEWETKLRELIDKIRRPRRVLLYLTNVNDLPGAGTTSSSKQNFVTLLAPYMRRGDVTVIGESTAEALQRGLEKDLSVKGLFQTFKVGEPSRASTLAVLHHALEDAGRLHDLEFIMPPEVHDLLLDLSGTYYSTMSQPGRSVTVLRQVIEHVRERGPYPDGICEIHAEDVITGLARFTGLPELLLNDKLPLDVETVRAFFDRRVLGQPVAVSAIVDLITLIKAGLNDPTKPLGVFLFVGPTGVGKTEIAKTLAEFIFGGPTRMLRFDLSEYKEYESFEKLIGGTIHNREEGQLTSKVREQPFSVILLDEIEKAHPNIFDLFLQVFDDGRLTDSRGRVADFRHTIIIMTSNIASVINPGGAVGFGDGEDGGMASPEGILREVRRFFRPEFLNRIDRTVVFRPLEADTMRKIALRELGQVLLRSGLLRRRLVVDIDDSIVDFLMAQGFSRAYGARPLKRAVERHVLLPVAREIVRGHDGVEDLLTVQVEPVDGVRQVVVRRGTTALAVERDALILEASQPAGRGRREATPRSRKAARAQLDACVARLTAVHEAFPALREAIAEAEDEITRVTFWDEPELARAKLQRVMRLKAIREATQRVGRRGEGLERLLNDGHALKAWHEGLVEWDVELRILEALARSLTQADDLADTSQREATAASAHPAAPSSG